MPYGIGEPFFLLETASTTDKDPRLVRTDSTLSRLLDWSSEGKGDVLQWSIMVVVKSQETREETHGC